jgi:hypothetical protein
MKDGCGGLDRGTEDGSWTATTCNVDKQFYMWRQHSGVHQVKIAVNQVKQR